MKNLRNILAIICFALISTLSVTPVQAEGTSTVEYSVTDSQFGYWLKSTLYTLSSSSERSTTASSGPIFCSNWDDPLCAGATQLLADLIQTPCIDLQDRGCIEGVEVASGQGELEKLTLVGEATETSIPSKSFPLASSSGGSLFIPRGGGISLWRSNKADSDGRYRTYMAHLLSRYSYYCGDLKNVPSLAPVKSGSNTCATGTFDFKGSIIPVTIAPTTSGKPSCEFFTFQNSCVFAENFSGNEKVAVTLRQDKSLTGWLFGRMQNAEFSVAPIDSQFNRIRISGQPTFVPPLKATVPKSEITRYPKLERYLKTVFNGSDRYEGEMNYNTKGPDGNWLTYPDFLASGFTRMLSQLYNRWALFDAFEESLKPIQLTATNNGVYAAPATNSILWNFASAMYESADLSPCSADKTKLHGLVVTNAPVYETGPPKFRAGVLDYRVAGVHNNVDGSEFKGEYTFVVRSDTARCFYGFSQAPIEARVTVVSSDGSEQIATVVVSERDNFLKLDARGFTFSSPTIKIKLTQPVPITKPVTKKKISCIKGKVVKVVTGINPKCPSGFRVRTTQ